MLVPRGRLLGRSHSSVVERYLNWNLQLQLAAEVGEVGSAISAIPQWLHGSPPFEGNLPALPLSGGRGVQTPSGRVYHGTGHRQLRR